MLVAWAWIAHCWGAGVCAGAGGTGVGKGCGVGAAIVTLCGAVCASAANGTEARPTESSAESLSRRD